MKKEVIVLSLGGSLIIPEDLNLKYLKKFKQVLKKNTKKYKFIIVCGGGSIARRYISGLKKLGINEKLQSYAGISATRMNARTMNYIFNQDSSQGIPHTLETLKKEIKERDIVFCGALEYKPKQTSDSTAADIAKAFNTIFINLTNVAGLYDKDPRKKGAKFIPKISWQDFDERANKIKFKPGQHFVLDQTASGVIMKHRIKTYILGENLQQLDKLLNGKRFVGTEIFE